MRGKRFLVIGATGHLGSKVAIRLAVIDRFLGGGAWASGNAPSLADCVLVPMLNAVTLLGARLRGRDEVADHPWLAAYWQAAKEEPVHARVIAEQLAQASRL